MKIFSENEVKTCSVQEEKEKEEDQCWSILLQVLFKIRPCSHNIGFCYVSQNYTVWCEHTFPSIFMLSMGLKTWNIIILMCFDGKNNSEKKNEESTAIVITKECRKY